MMMIVAFDDSQKRRTLDILCLKDDEMAYPTPTLVDSLHPLLYPRMKKEEEKS
jgi:hypothetical protein